MMNVNDFINRELRYLGFVTISNFEILLLRQFPEDFKALYLDYSKEKPVVFAIEGDKRLWCFEEKDEICKGTCCKISEISYIEYVNYPRRTDVAIQKGTRVELIVFFKGGKTLSINSTTSTRVESETYSLDTFYQELLKLIE